MTQEIRLGVPCFRVFDALVSEVERGLRDYSHQLVVDLAPFRGALAEACITRDLGLMFRTRPAGLPEKLDEDLVLRYYEFVAGYHKTFGDATPVHALPLRMKQVESELHERVFGRPLPGHEPEQAASYVRQALAVAEWNMALNESRLAALYFMGQVFPRTSHVAAIERADAARDELIRRGAGFYADYMKFAIMTGDAAVLDAARKRVYAESLADRFGIMQYLEVDKVFLHKTSIGAEDAFRGELKTLCKGAALA